MTTITIGATTCEYIKKKHAKNEKEKVPYFEIKRMAL